MADSLLEGQEVDSDLSSGSVSSETPAADSNASPASSGPDSGGEGGSIPIEAAAAQTQVSQSQSAPDGQAAASPEPVASPFLQKVTELGFVNVKDEEEARQRLLESYEAQIAQQKAIEARLAESQQFVLYGQQYLQQLQDPAYQQFIAQRQAPAKPQSQEPESWWAPPKFDPSWVERYREVDEDGIARWKAGTPAEVRVGAEQYQAYIERWSEDLVRRPHEVLPKIIREEARKLFEEEYERRTERQEVLSFAEQVKNDNAEWLYARDPRTQGFMTDPSTGQPYYSAEGERAMQWVAHAEKIGISDPRQQWDYAVTKLQVENASRQASGQTAQAQASQAIESGKMALLKSGAGHIPSRAGSEAPIETPSPRSQNQHLSPGKKLLQELNRDGFEFR